LILRGLVDFVGLVEFVGLVDFAGLVEFVGLVETLVDFASTPILVKFAGRHNGYRPANKNCKH
jgi:hypothetical protein